MFFFKYATCLYKFFRIVNYIYMNCKACVNDHYQEDRILFFKTIGFYRALGWSSVCDCGIS